MLNFEAAPSKVVETRSDTFTARRIHMREDGLVLYLPEDNASNRKPLYEIVIHRSYIETLHQTFSLYRTPSCEDAELRFVTFKDKLLVFVEIAKDMFNVQGLQKVCDVLIEHPTWNVAHLAAYFALYESFNNAKIASYLNSSDDQSGMSPLQVAITTKNLKSVQLLVAANCSLEHLDHNFDSVFHFAATANKEIISVSVNAVERLF